MALTKITPEEISQKGVCAAPDRLTGTAAENKAVFDRLIREVVAGDFNGLVDALTAATGASEIGATVEGMTGKSVQALLMALKAATDQKVEAEAGKGLSQEDFTPALKEKLEGIAEGANSYVLPVATQRVLGGVKQGMGVEITGDGTLNGLSAPAPDLVCRADLAEHVSDPLPHVTAAQKAAWDAKAAGNHNHNSAYAVKSTEGVAAAALPKAGGTMTGVLTAGGAQAVGAKQVRNIYAGTGGMTAGTTSLATGCIYLQYE